MTQYQALNFFDAQRVLFARDFVRNFTAVGIAVQTVCLIAIFAFAIGDVRGSVSISYPLLALIGAGLVYFVVCRLLSDTRRVHGWLSQSTREPKRLTGFEVYATVTLSVAFAAFQGSLFHNFDAGFQYHAFGLSGVVLLCKAASMIVRKGGALTSTAVIFTAVLLTCDYLLFTSIKAI